MTHLINGKEIALNLRTELKKQIDSLEVKPGLSVILVGDDPASHVYVKNKIKACESVGIVSSERRLPEDATFEDIATTITALNNDASVHGILLQLPIPQHLASVQETLVQMISPEKDVDGLTTVNAGKLFLGINDGLVPCTPQGSLLLIKSIKENLSGLNAVVLGRSNLFGKPMAQLLLQENCTVTTAHSRTQNIEEVCRQADILVAAVGRPKMVKKDWIKKGAIVIDVGINRLETGKLCGDVDFEDAQGVAGSITPVPGGVGPMTIACLLQNTLKASGYTAP
ncbi:MAG: bifunctional 5,10-methylenetetrahydrofolate dehydrogenase/5,10-methenyltetrahydrofolate cyclohydrolase [Bdellovibrionales bacterium]